MNDLASYMSLSHLDLKVLDLNIHVKHIMHFFLEGRKIGRFLIKRLLVSQLFLGGFIEGQRCDGKALIQELYI